eukprot:1443036-Alexandrium_andersonii.AAC.1
MSASLVGSEMCIRDRASLGRRPQAPLPRQPRPRLRRLAPLRLRCEEERGRLDAAQREWEL